MNAEQAGLTLLAMAEVPQVMSAFLPSPFTAATFGGTDKARWLRRGEVVGGVVSIGIAAAISMTTRSALPLVGAGVVLAVFLIEYERALEEGRRDARDMTAGATG